jgi:uncharacterized membrane protein
MKYVLLYILTFLVFLAIDAVWLLFISKDFYSKEIGHLMAEKALLLPALIFYLLFVVGVLIFIKDLNAFCSIWINDICYI